MYRGKRVKKVNYTRLASVILLLCMIIGLVPPIPRAQAFTSSAGYYYELDTNGIDIDAQYLIVSAGSAGSAQALRMDSSAIWQTSSSAVTVLSDDGNYVIDGGFANENTCLWKFSSPVSGTVFSNGHYLHIEQYSRYATSSATLQFASFGDGRYRIYVGGGADANLQYLTYGVSNDTYSWHTRYEYGVDGASTPIDYSYVYLYKRVEAPKSFDILYDGNGSTSGTLPASSRGVATGSTYTVLAPADELRMDVGNDTYLFRCWNTKADGTGTDYYPGNTFTVTEKVVLYAQWYLQTKYAVSVFTYLDGVKTDVSEIHGLDITLYIQKQKTDSDTEENPYIPLTQTAAGTYIAYVTENGTYDIVAEHDGAYQSSHGHKVVIFNQSGTTDLVNFSVSYDANGGIWAEGEEPAKANYHAHSVVTATDKVPTLEGYIFRGWKDQNGNLIQPGATVTTDLAEKTVLTAQWDNLIDVTVNVTIDHSPEDGGTDTSPEKEHVTFQLLKQVDGVYLPVGDPIVLTDATAVDNTTTYTHTFSGLEPGIYSLSTSKSGYAVSITHTEEPDGDETIHVVYTYAPDDFDLSFAVKVNLNGLPSSLLPKAVNVKVLCWGYDYHTNNNLNWNTISQQILNDTPTTVAIDENGNGSGFYPVWKSQSGESDTFTYRVEVTSFVMADGSVVPVSGQDHVTYTSPYTGLYTATVSVDGGRVPIYPANDSNTTNLTGAYWDGNQQVGAPVVTIDVTPFTVTFDAGEGSFPPAEEGGEPRTGIVLTNQYAYPDLNSFIPTPNDSETTFAGWYIDSERASNQVGSYLSGDVVYTAKYTTGISISGAIEVAGTYEHNGEMIAIPENDRAEAVWVVVQRKTNNYYNDVVSKLVNVTYNDDLGTGKYEFTGLPGDAEYRIHVLTLNYQATYDNDGNQKFTVEEAAVSVGANNQAVVDAALAYVPESYNQWVKVDVSAIAENFRPTEVMVHLLGRNLGNSGPYDTISQHDEGHGLNIPLNGQTSNSGFYDVWNWHTEGSLYEYQASLYKAYGTQEHIFTEAGETYDFVNSPYYLEHGQPAYWVDPATGHIPNILELKLIPREYNVIFDLNLGGDDPAAIQGMDDYRIDGGTNDAVYAYVHTWSYEASFSAFPYREGYVFTGWESPSEGVVVTDHGNISIGAAVYGDVTLTANWEQLTGTDYTVRYLELNTDKVLRGAEAVKGSTTGASIAAADKATPIEGYEYVGALVNGTYYDKSENPALTVSNNPHTNVMVIYYLPDGSDGYTEQVESNLQLDKTAVLEDNGTYTVTLETHTKDNPITTYIQQNTPLDIVMVLDQSGSIIQSGYLDDLQAAINNFIALVAEHGREHEVDHRIAMVGYAGDYDEPPTSTDTNAYPIAGGNTTNWVNTGVFDSNGDFHPYTVTGFDYTPFNATPDASGIYYAYSHDEYLLLTHHDEYYHLVDGEEARLAALDGERVYAYLNEAYVELTRNSSGLWLYGDRQLYSGDMFFTHHTDVWTHRQGLNRREIHAYGTGANYVCSDGHDNLYTRTEVSTASPDLNVYHDALVPVSMGASGTGRVNPGLTKSTSHLGSNGGTYVQYGIEMANKIFEANPLGDNPEGRVRIMIMFTDGLPGIGTFDATVANEAINQAYTIKNTHNAHSYTIGLYNSGGVDAASDIAYYMNAVSSNYPDARQMSDVMTSVAYQVAADGSTLTSGGPYYVKVGDAYYELTYSSHWVPSGWFGNWVSSWGFTANGSTTYISDAAAPTVSNGQVGGYTIYTQLPAGYAPTEYSGYYSTTNSEQGLKDYFAHVMQEITTRISTEIVLHEDTILRDIMGQGLVLTPGTVVTAYTQAGTYNTTTGGIDWGDTLVQVAQVTIPENNTEAALYSPETTTVSYRLDDGTEVTKTNVPYISVYNLQSQNPTDPMGDNYHPHTVDITGYQFDDWYINSHKTDGHKMVVKITRIEARDDVQWGRSVATNYEQSGLWLPADAQGDRQLLLPFEQPTTIFVERAYVLDYGKGFTLGDWYFDSEGDKVAQPIHVDCVIEDGMNWFDETNPNTANSTDPSAPYGNTRYGNVSISNGKVTYTPVTTNWKHYDQFYVFGNTWRKTVLSQDANENGNLWSKVTVIPANNVYYEDSFVTTADTSVNGVTGLTFHGTWQEDGAADGNEEHSEHLEHTPYGNVHGWTDSLNDDLTYTDGSAHCTSADLDGKSENSAQFSFTGTGVDIYTRTNSDSGMVFATIRDLEGSVVPGQYDQIIDNLAVSGDYYHIPTVSFKNLPYGTYQVKLFAAATTVSSDTTRQVYYLDGIRVYNPLGNDQRSADAVIKSAYEYELNAVFTEVRDVLLGYQDFNTGIADGADRKMGAVFIDWIREGQGIEADPVGKGVSSYQIGTYKDLGPKNEVYLTAGQAIVIPVSSANTYFVGLKSLTGTETTAHISGIDLAEPTAITLSHSTDMYYKVTPMEYGGKHYIVIQNGASNGSVLAVTKLRATNLSAPPENGGLEAEIDRDVCDLVALFADEVAENLRNKSQAANENTLSLAELHAAQVDALSGEMFAAVRSWMQVG